MALSIGIKYIEFHHFVDNDDLLNYLKINFWFKECDLTDAGRNIQMDF